METIEAGAAARVAVEIAARALVVENGVTGDTATEDGGSGAGHRRMVGARHRGRAGARHRRRFGARHMVAVGHMVVGAVAVQVATTIVLVEESEAEDRVVATRNTRHSVARNPPPLARISKRP